MKALTQLEAKASRGGYTNSKLAIAIAFCYNKLKENKSRRLL